MRVTYHEITLGSGQRFIAVGREPEIDGAYVWLRGRDGCRLLRVARDSCRQISKTEAARIVAVDVEAAREHQRENRDETARTQP